MEKEFEKYDRDDLRSLIEFHKWLFCAEQDLATHLSGRLNLEMPSDFSWLQLYDGSYVELIAVVIKLFNSEEKVIEFSNSPDPQKAAIEWGRNDEQIADVDDAHRSLALAAFHALLRTCSAISYYGYPLDRYMSAYQQSKDDQILFKMLRIDKSILSHSSVMRRTAIAEAEGDAKFFRGLAKAVTGRPHKKLLQYPGLRYCLVALHDDGGFDRLTENLAYDLFCLDLKVYPEEGDAGRSLWQFIQRWKKNYPT